MFITVTLNPAVDKKITVDEFLPGGTNKCKLVRSDLSGKGINVSKVLASLGKQSVAAGFMSDTYADAYAEHLGGFGVTCDFTRISGEIRTNIKLHESSNRETEINENGPTVTPSEASAFMETLLKYLSRENILCISGSLPRGLPADFYGQIIRAANENGVKTLFDSSGVAFGHGVCAAPYAVLPNIGELEEYSGERLRGIPDIKRRASEMLGKGVSVVIVSMGERGACFFTKEYSVHARPDTVITVKGTIGAGDAITAAFAAGLRDNLLFADTARLCIAAAGAGCMEEGTVPGTPENIERLIEAVRIEEI